MKIKSIDCLHCKAGWRIWSFVKIQTNDDLVGWSEVSESNGSSKGIEGVINDLSKFLINQNPLLINKISSELYSRTIQSSGGVVQKAIAGIENALLDIKGKFFNQPVHNLFGGKVRESIPLYWSHCGTSRLRAYEMINKPPIKSYSDLKIFCNEINNSGFKYVKTNIGFPQKKDPIIYMPGTNKTFGWPELELNTEIENKIEKWIKTFSDNLNPSISIILDLNYNFKAEGYIKISRILEKYNIGWLEIDTKNPNVLKKINDKTKIPICSGENLLGQNDYKPFIDNSSVDIVSIDIIWNGFLQSKKIADYADASLLNITPHNFNGILSTFISAHFSAITPNLKIMEIDMDDVPWREELFTVLPKISNGNMDIPEGSGWGTEINEKILKKYEL